jgi:hypothetical protein
MRTSWLAASASSISDASVASPQPAHQARSGFCSAAGAVAACAKVLASGTDGAGE